MHVCVCLCRYGTLSGSCVPFSIVNQANQANQLYPHAVSLMESIKTYELMCTKVLQVWWLSGSICE